MEFVKVTLLAIYTAEDVLYDDMPLYKAIIEEARRCKLAGGTVIRASEGYGTSIRGMGNRAVPMFFSGTPDLPVLVEIVDTRKNINKILPFLEKCGKKHFLAIMTELDALVTDYLRDHADQLKKIYGNRAEDDQVDKFTEVDV